MAVKPIPYKNYGSIPHLPNSRLGKGDHSISPGQASILTVKKRNKHDEIIVQEKLDGSNVGVIKLNGRIISLSRSGYTADSSPYLQHRLFADWVRTNERRFDAVLDEGERIVGEWLLQAHGTRYKLIHEPFVAFDIMKESKRLTYDEFIARIALKRFVSPFLVHRGESIAVDDAMALLGDYGRHGAIDYAEGLVYRVENKGKVEFLTKYVRGDKVDGRYLESVTGETAVWNDFDVTCG